jgi:transposase
MLIPYENRQIFIASKPVDFRMSIDGLSNFVQREKNTQILDGSIYVFFNAARDKIKCLFWDGNGFVLYYKRLVQCKFKIYEMLNSIERITASDLEVLLAGFDPKPIERKLVLLENNHG